LIYLKYYIVFNHAYPFFFFLSNHPYSLTLNICKLICSYIQLFHHLRQRFRQYCWTELDSLRMRLCTLVILKARWMRRNFMNCSIRLARLLPSGFVGIRWCSHLLAMPISIPPMLVMVPVLILVLLFWFLNYNIFLMMESIVIVWIVLKSYLFCL